MKNAQPYRIKSISEYHQLMGLPKPEHPLVSMINLDDVSRIFDAETTSVVFDFYSISLKKNFNGKMKYGQQEYDFDEGVMFFIAPGQVIKVEVEKGVSLTQSGWLLFIHPDFLWNTPLAKAIRQYEFFDYSVNEALFLSEKEEATITAIAQSIAQEYHDKIDRFTQDLMIAQLEVLLKYAERFYDRQFITRKIINHQILGRFEDVLNEYLGSEDVLKNGLPTVTYVAGKLNLSASYLSAVLRTLTGQSTQQHIHDKLIEKAKERLSTTDLSVSEIAYELGLSIHSLSVNYLRPRPVFRRWISGIRLIDLGRLFIAFFFDDMQLFLYLYDTR